MPAHLPALLGFVSILLGVLNFLGHAPGMQGTLPDGAWIAVVLVGAALAGAGLFFVAWRLVRGGGGNSAATLLCFGGFGINLMLMLYLNFSSFELQGA